jgi:aminoglycoside 6-adenylyltransferase
VERRVRAFLDEVAAWADEQPDVHSVLLLGSQARSDVPADEASDVDLVLFVEDPGRYLGEETWLQRFGEPLLTFVEPTAVGGFEERRVLFRAGLEVDFSVLPAAMAHSPPVEVAPVLARGFRVVVGEAATEALDLSSVEPARPTQAQFDQLATDFWYHLLWGAKKLWRGEVLLAKQNCDCWLTSRLIELARWRSHGLDTWHGLRFFERWAGDDLLEALPATFARYDAADVARALRAKGELFRKLEDDVAALLGLTVHVDREEVLRRLDELVTQ